MRGQTTLDFAVGMSIFLLLVAFTFVFVPGFLAPFTTGPVEETVTANRVVDELALDLLGSTNETGVAVNATYVLDVRCTEAFFDGRSPEDCTHNGDTLRERVGVTDRQFLNVTITGNLSDPPGRDNPILCWDDSSRDLSERGSGSCGGSALTLAVGPNPMEAQETVTARRVVGLNGTDVTLEVEVW